MGLININIGEAFKKVPGKVWMIIAIALLILAVGLASSLIRFGSIHVGHDDPSVEEYPNEPAHDPKGGK